MVSSQHKHHTGIHQSMVNALTLKTSFLSLPIDLLWTRFPVTETLNQMIYWIRT